MRSTDTPSPRTDGILDQAHARITVRSTDTPSPRTDDTLDQAHAVHDAITAGGWIPPGLAAGGGMSALDAEMRPIDKLPAAGLSWLTRFIQPLQTTLDRLAGKASVIQTFAHTWQTAASTVEQVQTQLTAAAPADTAAWKGDSGDAYRRYAHEVGSSLQGTAILFTAVSTATTRAGEVVASARTNVNELLTHLVDRLISATNLAVAVEGGVTTSVVAQATDLVNSYSGPIADIEQQARQAVENLGTLLGSGAPAAQPPPRPVRVAQNSSSTMNDASPQPAIGDLLLLFGVAYWLWKLWSKPKARDDGFAPGTHNEDKGLDPSAAKPLENRSISGEPVPGIENQDPVLPIEDKVKDEKYREKYYDGPAEDGSYRRKNASQKDADGQDVPILTVDKDGEIQPKSTDYTGMDYRKDIPDDGPRKATSEQAEDAQDLIDRRADANKTANEVEARYQKAKEDGTLTAELADERAAAHRARTERGQALGELAGHHAIDDEYRDSDRKPHQVPTKDTGAGTFDQVYEIKDKDGNTVGWDIVEAKSPNAELGVRKGLDGQNYEQGHPKYLEAVLKDMHERGDHDLADKLDAAAVKGEVGYMEVKAKVSHETVDVTQPDGSITQTKKPRYGGYDRRHFDISGYRK